MNRAHTGLPGYLTQLAGRPATVAAPLRPRRPLFDPAGGDTAVEQPWAVGDSAPAPIPASPTAGRTDHPPTGACAVVGGEGSDARRAAPAPVAPASATPARVPAAAGIAPAPPLAPVPAASPMTPRARSSHDEPPTATALFAPAPAPSPPPHPPAAAPMFPQVAPVATPIPVARPGDCGPAADLVPQPATDTPPAEIGHTATTAPPRPAAAAEQQQLLPRATERGAVTGEPAPSRRSAATPAAAAARVSIGTIEVTVVPPTPIAAPAPPTHPLVTGAHAPARGGPDLALHGARGASRRWFGAGQS